METRSAAVALIGVYRGNAAYNASKAAVKAFTESLSHELRSRPQAANVTAHLFMCVLLVLGMVKLCMRC